MNKHYRPYLQNLTDTTERFVVVADKVTAENIEARLDQRVSIKAIAEKRNLDLLKPFQH